MKKCDIVVFIPTFNAEKFIEDALDSVLSQTEKEIIILISDDCSIDQTIQKIKKYLEIDQRIILIQNDRNLGVNENLNRMINYTQENIVCDYIAFFAGDDLMLKNRLTIQKQILDTNKNIHITFSPVQVKNHDGARAIKKQVAGKVGDVSKTFNYDYVIKNSFPFVTNCAFARWAFVQFHRYEFDFCSDFLFFIDISLKNKGDIYYFSHPLGIYRRHIAGLTSGYNLSNKVLGYSRYYLFLLRKYPIYSPWIIKNLTFHIINLIDILGRNFKYYISQKFYLIFQK